MGTQKLQFDYFYNETNERKIKGGFFQVPVLLLEHPAFKSLGYRAKNLYAYLFARTHQSAANPGKFSDENGRVFVYCTIKEIMEKMDCASEAAVKTLRDLEKVGLVEKNRRSSRATTIYVKNLYSAFDENGNLKEVAPDGKLQFDYIYGTDIQKYDFYKIPTTLMKHPVFDELRHGPKILYSLLLARAYNSCENGTEKFTDDEGRVFIRFSVAEVMEKMRCQSQAAVRMLKDLEDFGLIERKRYRRNETAIIYVKDFHSIFDENGVIGKDCEGENEPKNEAKMPFGETVENATETKIFTPEPNETGAVETKFWKSLCRKLKKHIGTLAPDNPDDFLSG